eukprot:Clim_evm106s147 gene=Clim_evmTU106s147
MRAVTLLRTTALRSRTERQTVIVSLASRSITSEAYRKAKKIEQDRLPNTLESKVLIAAGHLTGMYSKGSLSVRMSKRMYDACYTASENTQIYDDLELPDTFMSWFAVTNLHVWLTMYRLRQEGQEHKPFTQELVNFFWQDVEERMRIAGLSAMQISSSMKQLQPIYYGSLLSFDEGIESSDTILASALWRNIFQMKGDVDKVARMVNFVRYEAARLEQEKIEDFVNGLIPFSHWQEVPNA